MWTDGARTDHARAELALPWDLMDGEWAVPGPLLPRPSRVGRPRKWRLRRIVEAIPYLLCGGLPWRMPPPCFPPVSTVRRWVYLWRDNGLWLALGRTRLMAARGAQGREAPPGAGAFDSQSVKTTESGAVRRYAAAKKIRGRKRRILTDALGHLAHAVVHAANIRDRDGAPLAFCEILARFPWPRCVFADGGQAGGKLNKALRHIGEWAVEIIKRSDAVKDFEVLPCRWVVNRRTMSPRSPASSGLRLQPGRTGKGRNCRLEPEEPGEAS